MAKVVRVGTFWAMVLWSLLGTLFIAGYALDDPGGAEGAGATALWVVPMLGLSAFAVLRPHAAVRVLVVVTGAVMLFTLADATFQIIPRDDWGPVAAVVVFATGVTLGFLGLHRPGPAGGLLVGLSLVQLTAVVLYSVFGPDDRPLSHTLLAASSGVLVAPLLFFGALFLLAAALGQDEPQLAAPAH